MNRGSAVLISVFALLVTAAAVVTALGARPPASRETRAAEFQRLIGGLGGGTATSLTPCAGGFDPRLESDCSQDVGPVPAAKPFCPCHGSTVAP